MANSEWIKGKTLEYYQAIKAGTVDFHEATNKIVEYNIPLVYMVVGKYKPWSEDNFQIGCIGLINAARTYQIDKGVPFASYAAFCIEREVQLAYNRRMSTEDVSDLEEGKKVRLDAPAHHKDTGEEVNNYDFIFDEKAEEAFNQYIKDNELTFICENVIKPTIESCSPKQNKQTKVAPEAWKRAEFAYVMDLVFIDSQKQRLTLKDIAEVSNVSVPNVRTRHLNVMNLLFQKMWGYMNVKFYDLFERIRGDKKVPQRLLCLDPGKTTGWCLFESGHLTRWGQVENCFDDKNIDTSGLIDLFVDINPDFILYEDYKVYASKLERHTFNPVFTLRIIGAIETYAQMAHIPTHNQMAVTAKNFCTDEKLKQWDYWQSGMRHARDAIRHGCYFLLFYKKGEDI